MVTDLGMTMWFPRPPMAVSGGPTFINVVTGSAINHRMGIVCNAPKSGNIRYVHWLLSSLSGEGNELVVKLRTPDRTTTPTVPSSTLFATNSQGTVTPSIGQSMFAFRTQMDADVAVIRGAVICVEVIKTVHVGNTQIGGFGDDQSTTTDGFPYLLGDSAVGTYSHSSARPVVAFEYDTGEILCPPGCMLARSTPTITINSAGAIKVAGQRFILLKDTLVDEFWVWVSRAVVPYTASIVTADWNMSSPDPDTVKATYTSPAEDKAASNSPAIEIYPWPEPVELRAGVPYRFIIQPTGSLSCYSQDVSSDIQLPATYWRGLGKLTTGGTPTQDSDWTTHNNRSFFCGLGYSGVGGDAARNPSRLKTSL